MTVVARCRFHLAVIIVIAFRHMLDQIKKAAVYPVLLTAHFHNASCVLMVHVHGCTILLLLLHKYALSRKFLFVY